MILLIAENATVHAEQDNFKLISEKDINTVDLMNCDHVTIVHGSIEHAPFHIPDVPCSFVSVYSTYTCIRRLENRSGNRLLLNMEKHHFSHTHCWLWTRSDRPRGDRHLLMSCLDA